MSLLPLQFLSDDSNSYVPISKRQGVIGPWLMWWFQLAYTYRWCGESVDAVKCQIEAGRVCVIGACMTWLFVPPWNYDTENQTEKKPQVVTQKNTYKRNYTDIVFFVVQGHWNHNETYWIQWKTVSVIYFFHSQDFQQYSGFSVWFSVA